MRERLTRIVIKSRLPRPAWVNLCSNFWRQSLSREKCSASALPSGFGMIDTRSTYPACLSSSENYPPLCICATFSCSSGRSGYFSSSLTFIKKERRGFLDLGHLPRTTICGLPCSYTAPQKPILRAWFVFCHSLSNQSVWVSNFWEQSDWAHSLERLESGKLELLPLWSLSPLLNSVSILFFGSTEFELSIFGF